MDGAVEVPPSASGAGGPEKHRRMTVMATGMHEAGVLLA